jgi:hypothetical protein
MKIGRKIKDAKVIRQEKREIVTKIREQIDGGAQSRERVQVRSTLFDHQLKNESINTRGSKSLLS